jgi:hypothetical protein
MPELSTYEAARAYGAHPVTLQRLVAVGRLDGRKDKNGRWRISRKSLDLWNSKRLARTQKVAKVNTRDEQV